MTNLRITKYNPAYRDSSGKYLKSEWIGMSEIGNIFDGKYFTFDEYKSVEDNYLKSIELLIGKLKLPYFLIRNLEKPSEKLIIDEEFQNYYTSELHSFYEKISNNTQVNTNETLLASLLSLRGDLWCMLSYEDEEKTIYVEFGYDFYMYFRIKMFESEDKIMKLRNEINSLGLFVESEW